MNTNQSNKEKQLDAIVDTVDYMMRREYWELLNEFISLQTLKAWRTDKSVLVAYATITLGVKSKIPARKAYLEKCMELHPNKKLWQGLE